MKHTIFFLTLSVALITSCSVKGQTEASSNSSQSTENIAKAVTVDVNEFDRQLASASDYQLLDVRTEGEFLSGYIKGALWADWLTPDEFARRIEALDKNKLTFVYCLSGGRSSQAVNHLRQKGFMNIVELQGGINAWNRAGKPLVADKEVPQMSEKDYRGMLTSKEVVLVDFGAEWCAPCKRMNPIIEEIAHANSDKMGLVNIDAGSQKDLVQKFDVEQLPTFIIYKNGKEVWRTSGLTDKEVIEKALEAAY